MSYIFEDMGFHIEYDDEIMEGNQFELYDQIEEQIPLLVEEVMNAIRDQWRNRKVE